MSQEKKSRNATHQTTEDSLANKSSEPPTQSPKEPAVCIFCKKNHMLYACPGFEKISHQDRNKFVRSNRVCFHCLNTGHIASKCDYYPKRVCNTDGCQASHHRKLHPPKDTTSYCYEEEYPDEIFGADIDQVNMHGVSETTNHASNGTYVTIRTAPIILKIGDKKRRVIVALDACSNNTNISEELADELGLRRLKGEVTRYVDHMEHTRTVKSDMVQFNICPLDESAAHPVYAWTVKSLLKNIPVIDWKEEVRRYPHLRDLNVPETLPGDKVDILLGTDYAHLMGVTKSHIGKPGEPIAEFTPLGLAFCGKLKNCITKKQNTNCTGFVITREYITLSNVDDTHSEDGCIEILEEPTPPDITSEPTPQGAATETVSQETMQQSTQPEFMLEPTPPDTLVMLPEPETSVTSNERENASRRPYTIVVEGNIGSGKTSFLELVQASSPESVEIMKEPVEQWQNCQGNNLLELMYDDPKKNSFAFQTYVQLTKVQMHEKASEKPFCLMERSVLSARYCFIENLHNNNTITESEYAVLDEWFKHLTTSPSFNFKIDQIVYLRTDPTVSFERIARRGRPEEKNVPLEYIEQLHQLHEDWLFNKTTFQPLPAPVKIYDVSEDLSSLSQKFTLEEILRLDDTTKGSALRVPEQTFTAVKSTARLTKEEIEQNPNSCEKYSTFWDRVLHEAVKDVWEQDKILKEELSPGF